MIIGIGCDIVEHQTIKELEWESDMEVLNRIFSSGELELFEAVKELRFLAGRFAVKEAVVKCLQCGMIDGISLREIQTLQHKNGLPQIRLIGEIEKLSSEMGINHWHVSLTHSERCSFAFVVGENRTV